MTATIRNEEPSDLPAIEALITAAFFDAEHASGTEQYIVDSLREADALSASLVAEEDGVIIGHVVVSPVVISDGSGDWYGLGPIAVAPDRQRQGIGSRLMDKAIATLRDQGAAGCVVLGDPAYYARFGFRREPALLLPGVPPEYFQAVCFRGAVPSGIVAYHEAFRTHG